MTNPEIRQKALSKVKAKHLTGVAVLSYAIGWTARFFGDLTGSRALDAAIYCAACLVYSLIVRAGLARAALTAWRHGEARFGALFAHLRQPKLLLRGLAAGAAVLPLNLAALWVRPASLFASLAVSVGLLLLNAAAYFLFFALELHPEKPVGAALRRGFAAIFANFGRILLLELSIGWWILLVYFGALTAAAYAGLSGIALDLVATLVGLSLVWLVGAFVCLANAGLARELFRE